MNLRKILLPLLALPISLFGGANLGNDHIKKMSHKDNGKKIQKRLEKISQNGKKKGQNNLKNLQASPQVGALAIAGVIVPDLEAAMSQWSAGTGTQFGSIIEQTSEVLLPNGNWQTVQLRSAFSKRNAPFLELIEATPAIGPWAPQTDIGSAPGYLGYAVDNINKAAAILRASGMQRVARSDSDFSFYQGANGVLIKLVDKSFLPAAGTNIPQAPIDLGSISHTDIAVQDIVTVRNQLTQALNTTWTNFYFPNNPFIFEDGVHYTDAYVSASNTTPVIELEDIKPPLGIFASTDTTYNFHVSYTVPAGTVPAIDAQMQNAGFTLVTSAVIPGFGLILAYYENSDKVSIEVVDEQFDL